MLEIVLILAVAGAAIALTQVRRRPVDVAPEENIVDLPCPWCMAQTREDDLVCPGCQQRFGDFNAEAEASSTFRAAASRPSRR